MKKLFTKIIVLSTLFCTPVLSFAEYNANSSGNMVIDENYVYVDGQPYFSLIPTAKDFSNSPITFETQSSVSTTKTQTVKNNSKIVTLNKLSNLKSIKKKATTKQMQQAYQKALPIVKKYQSVSKEEQLQGRYI